MIEVLSLTGSTNADLAARLTACEPVREGCWLIADRQNAGRGRLGRVWNDGLGNFMGSTQVAIDSHQPHAGSLALVAGLAVQAAVAPLVPPPHLPVLKWPNDVLIGGAKLAGILLERVGDAVVVGVGVNLAHAPDLPDRDTVALTRFGPAPHRDNFAVNLAKHFAEELRHWRTFGLEALVRRWQLVAHPVGTSLLVQDGTRAQLSGRFAGLDAQGALRLTLADGTCRTIHAGDVHLACVPHA